MLLQEPCGSFLLLGKVLLAQASFLQSKLQDG